MLTKSAMKLNDNKLPIDLDFFKTIIGNDVEFEKELFQIFVDNSKFNISKMENALISKDSNVWYMGAHALKGSSASIGAFYLSKLLEIAQKNADVEIEEKQKIFEKVKEEFSNVENFILERIKNINSHT